MNFWPNPIFFKTRTKNLWSNQSKAFPTSIATEKVFICWILAIAIVSDINLSLSPMFLFWYYSVWSAGIRHSKISFNLFAIALDDIFISTFNNEISLKFLMYLLSLTFFLLTYLFPAFEKYLTPFSP